MVPIYICEDEEKIRNYIVDVIEKYIVIENLDMEIAFASENPVELLEAATKSQRRSIYFFDVDLKNETYNGFELAKKIREIDTRGFIIFITTHGELTFETFRYRVEAMDYIVKDDIELVTPRIQACLDSIQDRLHQDLLDQNEYYTVKIFDRIYNIPVQDILYFETSAQKHRIIVHALEEEYEFFGNLGEIEKQLSPSFIRSHRSYLVHRSNIKVVYFGESKIELVNGEYCPLSRKAKKQLKEE